MAKKYYSQAEIRALNRKVLKAKIKLGRAKRIMKNRKKRGLKRRR